MSAAETLAFRIDSQGAGPDRLRRSLLRVVAAMSSSGPGAVPPPVDQAVVVRVASGHPVLAGPVEPGLRRFLRRAVEGDLARMSEAEFLRAWGPPGGWEDRYRRWQDRGWVPPVR